MDRSILIASMHILSWKDYNESVYLKILKDFLRSNENKNEYDFLKCLIGVVESQIEFYSNNSEDEIREIELLENDLDSFNTTLNAHQQKIKKYILERRINREINFDQAKENLLDLKIRKNRIEGLRCVDSNDGLYDPQIFYPKVTCLFAQGFISKNGTGCNSTKYYYKKKVFDNLIDLRRYLKKILGNPKQNIRQYIDDTLNESEGKSNKNIFSKRNTTIRKETINYCNAMGFKMTPEFLQKCEDLDS